ncbi:predicted protein [Streptomyces albidoflavus]|nr:predicted protein [Streptomyces albidoflavus]
MPSRTQRPYVAAQLHSGSAFSTDTVHKDLPCGRADGEVGPGGGFAVADGDGTGG